MSKLAAFAVCLALLFAACAADKQDKLIAKWMNGMSTYLVETHRSNLCGVRRGPSAPLIERASVNSLVALGAGAEDIVRILGVTPATLGQVSTHTSRGRKSLYSRRANISPSSAERHQAALRRVPGDGTRIRQNTPGTFCGAG